MPMLVVALLAMAGSLWLPEPSRAQSVAAVFKKAAPSVVVIRARGRDVSSSGLTSFKEIGSGVLISPDAKVMTAAHVVQSMEREARPRPPSMASR